MNRFFQILIPSDWRNRKKLPKNESSRGSANTQIEGTHQSDPVPRLPVKRSQGPSLVDPTPPKAPAGGFFSNAHHVNMYNPIMQDFSNQAADTFMENFARYIIPGAAYDSSARFPPPRCHAGTRLETVRRARSFFNASKRKKRLLWIVGPAGVGKSAIMQTVAETSPNLGASLFFTVNLRDDPSKFATTLAYQISVHHLTYRENLRAQVTRDSTLLEKSITAQFEAFFIHPFTVSLVHGDSEPLLILIDGLDECAGTEAQCQILELILGFITCYPSSPLLWIIASRPEPHITSFFDQSVETNLYHKLELSYNSKESQQDVERFLRDRLSKIRDRYLLGLSHLPQWPPESQFLPLVGAADGLFAYAEAVSRFIEDPNIADPSSQLEIVLDVINYTSTAPAGNQSAPMAQLYALYDRIISPIPAHVLPVTKQILVANGVVGSFDIWPAFGAACQWIGLTPSKAYSAVHHLYSVLDIPSPRIAFKKTSRVTARHKSFVDFLCSRFPDLEKDEQLFFSLFTRVLKDIPLGPGLGEQPSQHIILHWADPHKSAQKQKTEMYSYASRKMGESKLLKQHLLSRDPNAIHALHVMSIGLDPKQRMLERQRYAYSWLLKDGSLRAILRKQKLLHDWQIGSVDLQCINTDNLFHTICKSGQEVYHSLTRVWGSPKCDQQDGNNHKASFRKPDQDSRHYKSEAMTPCKCKCTRTAWKHLDYIRKHSPETLVKAYIPAHRRGIVICDLPDRERKDVKWTYVIPYIFPRTRS